MKNVLVGWQHFSNWPTNNIFKRNSFDSSVQQTKRRYLENYFASLGCINTFFIVKETVSVISSDPPCKVGNAWFTTVPLNPLSNKNVEDVVFLIRKVFISVSFSQFFILRKANENKLVIKEYSYLTRHMFQGTDVNCALQFLHRGSLQIRW